MANKVIDKNEIYLDGTYYPLTRPVQSTLASLYPPKVTIGDTTRDSQTRASVISWSDWRGGIGVERMQGAADADKAWYSTLQLRYRRHLVLPALSVATRAQLSDGTAVSGAAKGDMTGFTLELRAEEKDPMIWLPATAGGGTAKYPFDGLSDEAALNIAVGT